MQDPQVKRLYAWESNMGWDDSNITFAHARAVICRACDVHKVIIPGVKLHKTRALPWSCPEKNIISLQEDRYLNVPICLHEATHHIVWNKHGLRAQDHGPTFLGIYLDLLARNGFNSYDSAKFHGLKWRRL